MTPSAFRDVFFELLWPLAVNARLNRYINLPADWETKAGSGFDTFLIEGFQFAGVDRNLDKVRWMSGYPFDVLSWPRAECRYLMGLFNASLPLAARLPDRPPLSRASDQRSGPTTICACSGAVCRCHLKGA